MSTSEENVFIKKTTHKFDLSESDLVHIYHKSTFVDKTMFIEAILSGPSYIQISAPRRFGKSTNMDMLKKFVEIEACRKGQSIALQRDELGYVTEQQKTSRNFRLFLGTRIFTVEQGAKQIFNKTFFIEHFGKYPVIYVDFGNIRGCTYNAILYTIRATLQKSFMEHIYLNKSDALSRTEKSRFYEYADIEGCHALSVEEVIESLAFLSRILCKHFNGSKKVYLLIDEYDTPISNAMYSKSLSDADMSEAISILSDLIKQSIKGNQYVERALFNCCLHVGNVLSAKTDNISFYPFLQSEKFCKFYGFTGEEVEQLLKMNGLSENIQEVMEWYNGYSMKLHDGNYIKIYNMCSMLHYLKDMKLDTFWAGGHVDDLVDHDRILPKISNLLTGKSVNILYKKQLAVSDIEHLKRVLTTREIDINGVDLYIQFLYESGYLNAESLPKSLLTLKIPNEEIHNKIKSVVLGSNLWIKYFNIQELSIQEFIIAFKQLSRCREHISFIELANTIKSLFGNARLPENDFQLYATLYILLKPVFNIYQGESSPNPKGRFRYDIVTVIGETAVAMELRTFGGDKLALFSILNNDNYSILMDKSIRNRIYLGIQLNGDNKIAISYLIDTKDIHCANTVYSTK